MDVDSSCAFLASRNLLIITSCVRQKLSVGESVKNGHQSYANWLLYSQWTLEPTRNNTYFIWWIAIIFRLIFSLFHAINWHTHNSLKICYCYLGEFMTWQEIVMPNRWHLHCMPVSVHTVHSVEEATLCAFRYQHVVCRTINHALLRDIIFMSPRDEAHSELL